MTSLGDLPSADAARKLVRGESGALVPVIFTTTCRAALIGAGLYAIGQRSHLVKGALAGAVAVEIFVLAWIAAEEAGVVR
jgi:hypothetical protein